ncbi:hypothetical protein [Mucilaginibacter sp.]|uniref:hypothetical protein n=1 Tax=Mucilaginibacter sp. TaxID=1882438 RepID=UPI00260C9E56|nr:hypothetical protein [Mucilaginibacter sp.]MDB4923628.1 hypothetical protein [Mucilaginibacter sp.]
MRSILIILFFMLIIVSAKSQSNKWQPGRFTDIKGNTESGFIRINPSAKGPIKGEGFIEFKEDNKATPFKLSASDLKSFVVAKDSFVVAHAPGNETWAKNELDFVKVEIDEDVKLYISRGGKGGKGGIGGSGIGFEPGIGIGTGGYGSGVSGGVSIPIGGGGGYSNEKTVYYYGTNTAEMKRITNENFEDVMTDIMGDEPEVVDKIHAKVYMLANIDRLIAYFKQVKAAGKN